MLYSYRFWIWGLKEERNWKAGVAQGSRFPGTAVMFTGNVLGPKIYAPKLPADFLWLHNTACNPAKLGLYLCVILIFNAHTNHLGISLKFGIWFSRCGYGSNVLTDTSDATGPLTTLRAAKMWRMDFLLWPPTPASHLGEISSLYIIVGGRSWKAANQNEYLTHFLIFPYSALQPIFSAPFKAEPKMSKY